MVQPLDTALIGTIQGAVAQGRALAESVMICTISFYDLTSSTPGVPLVVCPCRVKKPKPSSFDASNSTEFSTKRYLIAQIPLDAFGPDGIVKQGLLAQVEGANDPAIDNINFTVASQLDSTFAYSKNISLVTEIKATPRIT